ncbi:MAG: triose-phosphate isomerase [Deltaproteobacteria bacterium]|jgi:triosephosphate isomerase (TIM)|nr:triose-phosphate isomerase [Deltaproteobacteria bacterium]
MRKPFIAGNWKMNNTVEESLKFAATLAVELKATGQIDVAIAPPFTALYSLGVAFTDTEFDLAAQNIFWEDSGAYTAEISGVFLKEVGCKYAIVGHSERRQYFGETDETVNKRAHAALKHDLIPILCVGETLEHREAGKTWNVIESQLEGGLKGIDLSSTTDFVIAYEPVWAIGTGKTASTAQAEEVHGLIRNYLNEASGKEIADRTRILYGGSVKPSNSRELLVQPNIDGALVGGAALDVVQFADIIRNAH